MFQRHWYEKHKIYAECDLGFTGSNCSSPCPPGYFGQQCRRLCDCSPGEYCDAAKGCLCNSTGVNCADLGTICKTLKVVPPFLQMVQLWSITNSWNVVFYLISNLKTLFMVQMFWIDRARDDWSNNKILYRWCVSHV